MSDARTRDPRHHREISILPASVPARPVDVGAVVGQRPAVRDVPSDAADGGYAELGVHGLIWVEAVDVHVEVFARSVDVDVVLLFVILVIRAAGRVNLELDKDGEGVDFGVGRFLARQVMHPIRTKRLPRVRVRVGVGVGVASESTFTFGRWSCVQMVSDSHSLEYVRTLSTL